MAATETAVPPLSPAANGAEPSRDDSSMSSPLSEVDDKAAIDEDIDHMQLDGETRSDSSLSGNENNQAAARKSDSDSELSDAGSDMESEANDTEAETERLYDTPQAKRHRDVVVDKDGQVYERTPSKLRSAAIAVKDDDNVSGDDASIHSSRAASEAPPEIDSPETGAALRRARRSDSERKRKRSPASEQSELDQPLRKRSSHPADADRTTNGDDPSTAELPSGEHSVAEGDESPTKRDTAARQDTTERETRLSKKNTRSRSKRKSAEEEEEAPETISREDTREEVEEDAENQEAEDVEIDAEDEADAAAKNLEERKIASLQTIEDKLTCSLY